MDFLGEYGKLVTYIMIGFAILYVAIEVVLNINEAEEDTSNVILLKAAQKKLFFIPFALGAILGHLFLGTEDESYRMSNSMYPVIILFGVALLSVGIAYLIRLNKKIPIWVLSILLGLGLLYGHLFWSMNYLETL
ncbi:MAG: hypothetical protein R2819_00390 [Allomuricauda sp.]